MTTNDDDRRAAVALFDDHWQDDPGLIVSAWEDICDIEQDAWRRSAQAAIAAMRPASGELADDVELTIVAKRCVYLNDYRIAGGKPYVSENLPQHSFTVKVSDLLRALPMLQLKECQ